MAAYDDEVYEKKKRVNDLLLDLVLAEQRPSTPGEARPPTLRDLAGAVDELNRAWDELTSCLVRQRDVRDEKIADLLNDLASARKGR